MRAAQLKPAPSSGHRRPEPDAGSMKRRAGGGRTREGPRTGLQPWLRWVPAPLAILAAVIGALVMGSFQGQVAAANARRPPGYQAGGLALSVTTMLWMSNDMSGQGPVKGQSQGFSMAPSMMPGIQAVGENRLRVEVSLSNVTGDMQRYSIGDFSLAGSGSNTWKADGVGHSDLPPSANLQPGFGTTIELYFDVPAKQSKHLTLKWSRGGTTVSIPVHIDDGQPGPMRM
jgi:hypothetical protein